MDNSEPLQIPTSVRFDRDTVQRIEALAEAEHRSFSNMVRVLVSEGITARMSGQGEEAAA